MSISSLAANIWSSATTALASPSPELTPVSTGTSSTGTSSTGTSSTGTSSTGTATSATGATDPFQQLASDLQAWLTQLQSTESTTPNATPDATLGGAQSTTATPPHRHHHHHAAAANTASPDTGPLATTDQETSAAALAQTLTQALTSATSSG